MFKTPSTVRSTRSKTHKAVAKKHQENNLLLKNDFCEIKVLQKASDIAATDALLDIDSGFVVLNGVNECTAWNPRNSLISTTRLELPNTAVSCIVRSSYIGLIACSRDGLVRIWNNVELQSYQDFQLEIPQGSCPCFIKQYYSNSFLIGVDSGLLFKVRIGDNNISTERLTKGGSAIWGFFVGPGSPNTLLPKGQMYVGASVGAVDLKSSCFYAASHSLVQKWNIGQDGMDTFCWEHDITQLLSMFLEQDFVETSIVAIGACKDDTIALLIRLNFAHRSYYYKLLTMKDNGGQLSIGEIFDLENEDAIVPHLKYPKLAISNGGPIAFIAFTDRLITILMSAEFPLQKSVPFKNQDLIGVATDTQLIGQYGWQKEVSALLYSLSAGVLQIYIPLEHYLEANEQSLRIPEMKEVRRLPVVNSPDEEDYLQETTSATDHTVFSTLEQLVFFSQSDNPIALEMGPVSGDLNQPALILSNSLLTGTNSNLSSIMGESKYLHGVVLKCREIMNCIYNGGLVYKLTEQTRFQLLYEAERMAVMRDLWDYQNEIYTYSIDEGSPGFLESAITDFLALKGLQMSVKDFFKKMAFSLPDFFTHLQTHYHSAIQFDPTHYATLSFEMSKIFTVAYKASMVYRSDNEKLYKLDQRRLSVEPWNSTLDLIQVLQTALETSIEALRKLFEKNAGTVNYETDSGKQLIEFQKIFCELAKFTLGSFHSLKSYYSVLEDHRLADSVWERYQVVQKKVIDSMLTFSLDEEAFSISETFKDFYTLVQLALKTPNKDQRTKAYISRFGYDFAVVFYQYLLDKELLKDLIDQDMNRSDYLKEFLVSRNLLHLLWIQQFSHEEYFEASNTLWELANNARKTKSQSLCLAIAKLAYLETISYEDLHNDEVADCIRKFEIAEDLVQIHVLLNDHLKELIAMENSVDSGSYDIDQKTMKLCFPIIPKGHTITHKLMKSNLRSILSGEKLKSTEIIDVLTLVTPSADSLFSDALKLAGNQQESDISQFYCNLVWRRCWMSSDWRKIDQISSDNLMKDELQKTQIYDLIRQIGEELHQYLIAPADIVLEIPKNLADFYPYLDAKEFRGYIEELGREHKDFLTLAKSVDLNKYYTECIPDVEVEMEVDE